MRGPGSVATRLILWIVGSQILILSLLVWHGTTRTRNLLESNAREHASTAAHEVAGVLRTSLRGVEEGARALAAAAALAPLDEASVHGLLRSLVQGNRDVFGATLAYQPGAFAADERAFAPYYFRQGSGIEYADLTAEPNAYREQAWFSEPVRTGEAGWSEPYFDDGGADVEMVTYSVPVLRPGTSSAAAVATSDVSLASIRTLLDPIEARLGAGAEILILSRAGWFVSLGNEQSMLEYHVADVVDLDADGEVSAIVGRMLNGEEGFAAFRSLQRDEPMWVHFTPLEEARWSVAVLFLESRVLHGVRTKVLRELAGALAGIALLAGVVVVLARRITDPLRGLALSAGRMGTGDLDVVLPGNDGRDEVATLGQALGRMQTDLKRHIADLEAATAARERLESELRVAHEIQMAMLPGDGARGTGADRWEVAATLIPAKAVGGDLYDFIYLDADRLWFVIGDVSDKGVPAALFMARTLTLFKRICRERPSPGEVLGELNDELCRDNDACMFVTMFCGLLNTGSGELRCANAGHNPPLIVGATTARFMEVPPGTALGLYEDRVYGERRFGLARDESLLLYTDGVTEANDRAGELFDEHRLLALARRPAESGSELVAAVVDAVNGFAHGVDQADDITVVVLSPAVEPPAPRAPLDDRLVLASRTGEIERVREWLELRCASAGLGRASIDDLQLVCEEILANIIDHALAGRPEQDIEVGIATADDAVTLEFRDRGPPFNLLEAPAPDLDGPLEERPIGGLGIHLVKQLSDRLDYVRQGEWNVVTVVRKTGRRDA